MTRVLFIVVEVEVSGGDDDHGVLRGKDFGWDSYKDGGLGMFIVCGGITNRV